MGALIFVVYTSGLVSGELELLNCGNYEELEAYVAKNELSSKIRIMLIRSGNERIIQR